MSSKYISLGVKNYLPKVIMRKPTHLPQGKNTLPIVNSYMVGEPHNFNQTRVRTRKR